MQIRISTYVRRFASCVRRHHILAKAHAFDQAPPKLNHIFGLNHTSRGYTSTNADSPEYTLCKGQHTSSQVL